MDSHTVRAATAFEREPPATALPISPVAFHRWAFRRHRKERLLRLANAEALFGLALEAVSLSCAIALTFSFVGSSWVFSGLVSAVIAAFVFLWFVLPIVDRIATDADTLES